MILGFYNNNFVPIAIQEGVFCMIGNPIVVKMIESTIDKTIGEIKLNPVKGVKSLIGLGNRFANSPVQKALLVNMQTMLERPDSPYHKIIPNLVSNVNPHTLKTFIMTVAYNSWSFGGKKIKQYKRAYGFNIPWTIIFDFTKEVDIILDNNKILNIIEQGKKLGIYTYLFFTNNITNFSDILKQNPDCAFILYISPQSLTKEIPSRIEPYHNVFFSLLYQASMDSNVFKTATSLLYDNHCLFGTHSYYNKDNINYILNNQWIREVTSHKSPFLFLIESPDCIPNNASLVHNYIAQSKTNPAHATFLIDLYEDIAQINNQFSSNAHILKISSKGDISSNQSLASKDLNISTTPLLKVFSSSV